MVAPESLYPFKFPFSFSFTFKKGQLILQVSLVIFFIMLAVRHFSSLSLEFSSLWDSSSSFCSSICAFIYSSQWSFPRRYLLVHFALKPFLLYFVNSSFFCIRGKYGNRVFYNVHSILLC